MRRTEIVSNPTRLPIPGPDIGDYAIHRYAYKLWWTLIRLNDRHERYLRNSILTHDAVISTPRFTYIVLYKLKNYANIAYTFYRKSFDIYKTIPNYGVCDESK